MNRKEIIKEAQEQVNCCTPIYPESFIQGYLAGAEPREKQIAELEQELTVEKDLHQEEVELHLHAEEYIKSLEKENAELKHTIATLRKEKDNVSMHAKAMEVVAKTRSDQLTNAKEIIEQLLLLPYLLPYANNEEVCGDVTSYLYEAEQFLKEIEK